MEGIIKYRKVEDTYYQVLEVTVVDVFDPSIVVTTTPKVAMIDKDAKLAQLAADIVETQRQITELEAL
jgi:hypothetical protein